MVCCPCTFTPILSLVLIVIAAFVTFYKKYLKPKTIEEMIEGEEKMAIGGLSVDTTTLKNLLGIESFEDFKGGLTMVDDGEDNNFLIYKSEGPPAKEVQLAEVKVRQKGQGYASSVGLEFAIASDFSKKLYEANRDVYGDVQISNKEKRRLKI